MNDSFDRYAAEELDLSVCLFAYRYPLRNILLFLCFAASFVI